MKLIFIFLLVIGITTPATAQDRLDDTGETNSWIIRMMQINKKELDLTDNQSQQINEILRVTKAEYKTIKDNPDLDHDDREFEQSETLRRGRELLVEVLDDRQRNKLIEMLAHRRLGNTNNDLAAYLGEYNQGIKLNDKQRQQLDDAAIIFKRRLADLEKEYEAKVQRLEEQQRDKVMSILSEK